MRERYKRLIENSLAFDFKHLAKKAKHPREKTRFSAFVHLQAAKSITEVAEILFVTRHAIYEWLQRFEQYGLEGLYEQKGRGRKPHLHLSQREAFKQAVLELQAGREGGVINGKDVLGLMENKFGIKCTTRSVYNQLKNANLVWISSRSKHPKADIEKQEAFKKTSKKKF